MIRWLNRRLTDCLVGLLVTLRRHRCFIEYLITAVIVMRHDGTSWKLVVLMMVRYKRVGSGQLSLASVKIGLIS